jgi:hypothetical protein
MSGDLFANAGVKPEICCLPRAEHLCGWNYGNQLWQLELSRIPPFIDDFPIKSSSYHHLKRIFD